MVPTSAYGTAYSYTQPGLLVFESFPKRRTPGVCGAMSKMFVGGCWYFLEKCWKTGGKRTRCPRQPIVDMDVDCRRPRHDENYSSLFVENSHPETLHRDMCIACSGSSWILPMYLTNSQFSLSQIPQKQWIPYKKTSKSGIFVRNFFILHAQRK